MVEPPTEEQIEEMLKPIRGMRSVSDRINEETTHGWVAFWGAMLISAIVLTKMIGLW